MPLVCEKCVETEPGLQQFVSVKGHSSKSCDYCHNRTYKKIELNQLTKHLLDCLMESYQISKSKEVTSINISNFMVDYFPVPEENEKLFQDAQSLIKKEIGDIYLVEKKVLINSWDDFSNYVKKESRFFFSARADILKETMKIIERNDLIQK